MYEINLLKEEIIKCGKLLYAKNYSPATSGNISVRTKKGVLITASGSCLGTLAHDDIVLIDENANFVEGKKNPSSEKFLHTRTYQLRDDINAVIHCHSPKATSFSAANMAMDKHILAEFVFYFGQVPLATYAMPSSKELVQNTVECLKDNDAALMANHGVVACDKNLKNAFYKIEMIETYAEVYLNTMILGKMAELSEEQVKEIYELR